MMILSKNTPKERADVITKFVNVGKVSFTNNTLESNYGV